MKTAGQWLDEYGVSHQNPVNKAIHWLCVPAIYFTVVALLFALPFPFAAKSLWLNWATIAVVLVSLYYLRLNLLLGVSMLLFSLACVYLSALIEAQVSYPLWGIALAVFVLAWIGQFIGHHIEGKKPSFFKDIQFLMIGPMWVFGFVLRKLGFKL